MTPRPVVGMQQGVGGGDKVERSNLCGVQAHWQACSLTSARSFESQVSLRTYTWAVQVDSTAWTCNSAAPQADHIPAKGLPAGSLR